MRSLFLIAAVLAAGCDSSPGVNGANVTTEMIERVAKQQNVVEDVGATARLQPLGPMETPAGSTPCTFDRAGEILFFAREGRGVALVNGAVRTLSAEGSVGATGGFFRDREIGISIGVQQGGPARIVVTNRLTETREETTGTWVCGGN